MSCVLFMFGLLSSGGPLTDTPSREENCFVCFETVKDKLLHTWKTPCCHHLIHCKCLHQWLQRSYRCGYCRHEFNIDTYCSLCLHLLEEDSSLKRTSCCRTLFHAQCYSLLKLILHRLPQACRTYRTALYNMVDACVRWSTFEEFVSKHLFELFFQTFIWAVCFQPFTIEQFITQLIWTISVILCNEFSSY